MKLKPNLAGSLRFYFGLARALCMMLGALWLLALSLTPWIQKLFVDDPKLMVTVGEVRLQSDTAAVRLELAAAKPGSLALSSLQGTLRMDLASQDGALVSTLRWAIIPSIVVFMAFAWVVFGSLRNICAHLERGDVFTNENFQLIRRIGLALLIYGGASLLAGWWATLVMNGYLSHVAVGGLPVDPQFAGQGMVRFLMPHGLLSLEASIVIGGLVLLLSRAFRQGLNLKTESDLTV